MFKRLTRQDNVQITQQGRSSFYITGRKVICNFLPHLGHILVTTTMFGQVIINDHFFWVLISNISIVFSKFYPQNTQIRDFWSKISEIFFKFQPRITEIRHFGFQIWTFLFFREICSQTNLRVLISNMITVFSNSSPKIPK